LSTAAFDHQVFIGKSSARHPVGRSADGVCSSLLGAAFCGPGDTGIGMLNLLVQGVVAMARGAQWSCGRLLSRFMMGLRGPVRARRYPHGPYAVRVPADRKW
jgi:hypothetical protein